MCGSLCFNLSCLFTVASIQNTDFGAQLCISWLCSRAMSHLLLCFFLCYAWMTEGNLYSAEGICTVHVFPVGFSFNILDSRLCFSYPASTNASLVME
jgi:hypothetical protein